MLPIGINETVFKRRRYKGYPEAWPTPRSCEAVINSPLSPVVTFGGRNMKKRIAIKNKRENSLLFSAKNLNNFSRQIMMGCK
jgi:hypothetical protein